MKTILSISLALIIAAANGPAAANQQLAQKSACLACHAVDKKLVGPAYQEIAKKYVSQSDAAVKLAESIRKGGSGKWGPIPMPAQPDLNDADAKTLAEWVLSGAK